MLANGGGSVTLQFQRQPFQTQNVTVIVPWNRIITIDPVTLSLDTDVGQLASDIECSSLVEHNHITLKPVVVATWRHSQLGCCDNTPTSIVPEMRVSALVKYVDIITCCSTRLNLTSYLYDVPLRQ